MVAAIYPVNDEEMAERTHWSALNSTVDEIAQPDAQTGENRAVTYFNGLRVVRVFEGFIHRSRISARRVVHA